MFERLLSSLTMYKLAFCISKKRIFKKIASIYKDFQGISISINVEIVKKVKRLPSDFFYKKS